VTDSPVYLLRSQTLQSVHWTASMPHTMLHIWHGNWIVSQQRMSPTDLHHHNSYCHYFHSINWLLLIQWFSHLSAIFWFSDHVSIGLLRSFGAVISTSWQLCQHSTR